MRLQTKAPLTSEQKELLATKILAMDHTATPTGTIAQKLKITQGMVKSIRRSEFYRSLLDDAIQYSKKVFQHAVLRDVPPKLRKALNFAEQVMEDPSQSTSDRLKAADMLVKASGRTLAIDTGTGEEQQDPTVHIHLPNFSQGKE